MPFGRQPPKPTPEPEPEEDVTRDDHAEAVAWRLQVLEEARYPLDLAQVIAARLDIDLHRAVDLVKKGCPFKTAGKILL